MALWPVGAEDCLAPVNGLPEFRLTALTSSSTNSGRVGEGWVFLFPQSHVWVPRGLRG